MRNSLKMFRGIDAAVEANLSALQSDPERISEHFSMVVLSNRMRPPGNLCITGLVTNLGSSTWDDNYRVGIRHFMDRDGLVLPGQEFRGRLLASRVKPGQQVAFSFSIPETGLPAGVKSCEVDMVHEHHAWFSDLGAKPVTLGIVVPKFDADRSDWFIFLCRQHAQAPTASQHKLDVLQSTLQNYDYSEYESIGQVRDLLNSIIEGKPYRLPVPSSKAVARSLDLGSRSNALSAFYDRFAVECGLYFRDFDDAETHAGILSRFIRESRYFFKGGCSPLPSFLSSWLNQRALPRSIARTPATRSMFLAMEPDQSLTVKPSDNGSSLIWWFATSVLIDRGLTDDLIPAVVREELCRPASSSSRSQCVPPVSVFMRRLHEDNEGYGSLYNLGSEVGRCGFAFDLLMLGLENEVLRAFLGEEILAWMLTPVDPCTPFSPFEILLLAYAGRGCPPITENSTSQGITAEITALRNAYDWLNAAEIGIAPPTLRVIGEYESSTGLAVNMHMSIAALEANGIRPEVLDVGTNVLYPSEFVENGGDEVLKRSIDLFHLNLDAIPSLVCRYTDVKRRDVYRIGFALWETSEMPEQHRQGLSLVDEIWAPTKYVADVYANQGFSNCHVMGKGIALPNPQPFDLKRLGVPDDAFTFLMSFDVGSWVERKNPMAAVEAFRLAFPSDSKARLLIKTTGLSDHPGDRTRQIDRVLNAAARDGRIMLVNEHMAFTKYLGLIAAADASVSPHRSEGFGYLPAYSMLLDTPTIVTDYSGTTDFCTNETSFPVRAEVVDIAPGDFVYDAPGAKWANIDVLALAEAMRQVRDDPVAARARTKAGAALMRTLYSREALARRYLERLQCIR